ncbi:MAG: hypothetical protein N2109_07715 [Fimbriimonadales bacterium]|nr:hypothetical protein [Fimbriimonadales bacterium]
MDKPIPTPWLIALAVVGTVLIGGLLLWGYRRVEGPIVERGQPPADYFQRPSAAGQAPLQR